MHDDKGYSSYLELDFSIISMLAWVMIGAVFLALPHDILDRYEILAAFADHVASVIPMIDRVTEYSEYYGLETQFNRFFFAVMWVILFPYWVVSSVRFNRKLNTEGMEVTRLRLIGAVIIIPFFAYLAFSFFHLAPPEEILPNSRLTLMHSSRIGTVVLGTIFVSAGYMGTITYLVMLKGISFDQYKIKSEY